MKKKLAVVLVALGGIFGGLAGTGVFSSGLPAGILFQTQFTSSNVSADFGHTPQCANTAGQDPKNSKGTSHFFGDVYEDQGGSTSPTPGGNFQLGGAYTVTNPAGMGSARFVVPATPSGYGRTGCVLIPAPGSALYNTSDIGQWRYTGEMVYAPPGKTIGNTSDAQGEILLEDHFNAVSGNPNSYGLVARGGTGGWAVTDSMETGACAFGSSTVAVTGCTYRSHPTSCAGFHPIEFRVPVHCIQGPLYIVPPGQLVTGRWLEIVQSVLEATGPTGEIDTEWKYMGSSTWTQGFSVKGVPTVQWNAALYGNSATCPAGQSCGDRSKQAFQMYGPHQSNSYSFNVTNLLYGTSKTAVEALMP